MLMFTRNARSRSGPSSNGTVAALDVGTNKVCCLIAKVGAGGSVTLTAGGALLLQGVVRAAGGDGGMG